MTDVKVSDEIIERGVELWCRALRAPRYDNGDKSMIGFIGMGMASENARHDREGIDMAERIEAWREALVKHLRYQRDNDGKEGVDGETIYFYSNLSCDYGPCREMAVAANEVGIPHSAFSYKSTVYLDRDCVSAGFGYGKPYEQHYPLPDGRWLITSLRGEDMPKIIAAVMDGRLPELEVEGCMGHSMRVG